MDLIALPAFTDNYIWMLHDGTDAVVVDPGDAGAGAGSARRARQLALAAILVTHHHGIMSAASTAAAVPEVAPSAHGPRAGYPREPFVPLADGDTVQLLG